MTQAYDLDRIRQLALVDHSINDTLGIEFVEVTEGRVVGTMPVNQHSIQPYGILHGGASVVLAESIGSLGSAVLAMAEGTFLFVGWVEAGGPVVGWWPELFIAPRVCLPES